MTSAPGAFTIGEQPDLIRTKLHRPHLRADAVVRPRLVQRIAPDRHHRLTLVSAPPGFGKTSLLAEWASERDAPVAWLSLDQRDNDFDRFWRYVCAAFASASLGAAPRLSAVLAAPTRSPETMVTAIVNEIAGSRDDIVLVLDDYQSITTVRIQESIQLLLDRLPANAHLVIATRADPPLSLSRLRARAEISEIRAADLQFSATEAEHFFASTMGLSLSSEDAEALESRTEGWIAGLQLAAISLQGRTDPASFIASFSGNDRLVVDYLVDEVLQSQPTGIRQFLLETSILDSLSAPLCRAVADREDAPQVLEELERSNLFVVPLDDSRQWYRYHHLFADVLRAHAREQLGDDINTLHRRASAWYEEHGFTAEAIHHALAAGNYDTAATLAERAWRGMERRRVSHEWVGWVQSLPPEIVEKRPVLSLGFAWALLDQGNIEAAEAKLHDIRQLLARTPDDAIVTDVGEFEAIEASLATAGAYIAQARGEAPATREGALRAIDQLPEEDDTRRGSPTALMAMAAWAEGDLLGAERTLSDASESARLRGNAQHVITSAYVRSQVLRTLGRFHVAQDVLDQACSVASAYGLIAQTADLHTGLAELHLDLGNAMEAEEHLERSRQLAEVVPLPHWRYRWSAAQGRLHDVTGDPATAIQHFDDAERLYVRGPVPDVRPAAAQRARVSLRRGDIHAVQRWARTHAMPHPERSFLGEFDHVTYAALLIATNRTSEALDLLARLEDGARAGGRSGSLLEILVHKSAALERTGAARSASAALAEALAIAEPAGVLQPFIDEALALRPVLQRLARQDGTSPLVHRINAALLPHPATAHGSLAEPLTEREVEILRLLASGMRNQEVAEALVISVATVKRHVANAYGKLGASHRIEAIARASELGML